MKKNLTEKDKLLIKKAKDNEIFWNNIDSEEAESIEGKQILHNIKMRYKYKEEKFSNNI